MKILARRSIAKQFFQLLAGGIFTGVVFAFRRKSSPNEIEVLAKIPNLFFRDGIRAAVAALMGSTRVVAGAVQANPQVRIATVARFTAPRLTRKGPFPSALVTMACHFHIKIIGRISLATVFKKNKRADSPMQSKKFIDRKISHFETSRNPSKVCED